MEITKKIEKDNEILANFLGWELEDYFYRTYNQLGFYLYNPITSNNRSHHKEQLAFHESWEWLWLVIDKINSMGKEYHFAIFKTYASMSVEKGGKMYKDFHFAHSEYITPTQGSKEAVYKLLVKFVKWYGNALILEAQLKSKEETTE